MRLEEAVLLAGPRRVLEAMNDNNVPIPKVGDSLIPVSPCALTIDKSRQIANALLSGGMNWVKLVECFSHASSSVTANHILAETVVFDAEVELPQHPKYSIAKIERVAITFGKEDRTFPKVYALRKDFPLVPHINLESFELPRSLCLFDLPYSEIKLRWTAISFIERIRNWLADTATGGLHKSDQPLEPLLFEPDALVIFPPDFLSSLSVNPVGQVRMVVDEWQNGRFCFVEDNLPHNNKSNLPRFLVIGISGESQQHGTIRSRPTTMSGLADFLISAKTDLISQLRMRLSEASATFESSGTAHLGFGLIVVISLPKSREEGGKVESSDTYAFVCIRPEDSDKKDTFVSVGEIGERIGLWQLHNGRAGLLIHSDTNKKGDEIGLWMLAPCYPLSRENAPRLSGTGQRVEEKLVAVGLGALGSQIFLNLVRTGDGEWTTIDKDILLPHNFIRHAAYGSMAGLAKSDFSTHVANATIESPSISNSIIADVLSPGDSSVAVETALNDAAIVFDFSASQAVARHLALDVRTAARRVSAFLNPSGTDLVILAEDAERSTTLDSLEMQYYRLISSDETLSQHLRSRGQERFSAGCRDVSNTILPDLVARAAAIASSAIRGILRTNEASVAIWQGNEFGEIKRIIAPVGSVISASIEGWTILTDEIVVAKIRTWRKEKLPVETGGTLVGSYDMQRKCIYVADALPAPADSVEKRSSFVRGSYGLKPTIEAIKERTLENLQYVGEWHSHPAGHSASPSKDDQKLLATIASMQHKDGNPALMLIYGEDCVSWHTG